ncbi:Lymphocyte antigen 86 [Sciurus carolinensis]|uniref:Lymphocyte antigen 86 n=1 Tax=Sciurus carolinensis TaxID=30640 RepID=A0AA41N8J7_SCICA|nr:Lymphocyte antigen 86 [Sciurus carolinensis]
MNGFTAALLVWTLISPSGGGHGGRGELWPTHVACRNEDLEVFYQSCDPLQDFGFSIDECSRKLKPKLSIRFGIILREDIQELFLDVQLSTKGSSILNFSYPICEDDLPKFSFCGRRKGGKSLPGQRLASEVRTPGSAGCPPHPGASLTSHISTCYKQSTGNPA